MARPTIVIGLGGTGQWVVTFLKKALLETYGGQVPPEVKLLSFDTMASAAVSAEGSVQGGEDIRVGDVVLERNVEFIPLSGNSYTFAEGVKEGRYPHVAEWFDADYYLREAPQTLFDLAAGAAQIRQFGRLAFFLKAHDIWERIRRAGEEINRMNLGRRQIRQTEILIIASFAGGTGAGMFIDTGVFSRRLSHLLFQDTGGALIRGFFVLPSAFGSIAGVGDVQTHMQARSFAAWRELDRFMSVRGDTATANITYVEDTTSALGEAGDLEGRPFDIVYLVDAFREAHSLQGQPPQRGVFPALAEFLAAIIDEKSGPKFTEHTVNVLGDFDKRFGDKGARYSAFATYTLKVPVYYAQQNISLQLLYTFMKDWLAPEMRWERGMPVITGVKATANQEARPGDNGRTAALRFLRDNQVRLYVPPSETSSEEQVAISIPAFLQLVAELGDPDVNAAGNAQMVYSFAMAPADAGLRAYADLPAEIPARYQPLFAERKKAWKPLRDIHKRIPPSKEFDRRESPGAALARFQRQVPEFFRNHFGENGVFPAFLEKVHEFQVEQFRTILAQKMLWILNGESTLDAKRAKGGKVGFARDFLAGLVDYFDNFIAFLDRAQEERAERQVGTRLKEMEKRAYQQMARAAGKKCLFHVMFTHLQAWATQRLYLDAVQKRARAEADDRLLVFARRTAVEQRAIALSALNDMERWITHLATGDEAQGVQGLLMEIWKEEQAVKAAYEADKEASETQELLEMEEYNRDITEEINDLLGRVIWETEYKNGDLSFHCSLRVPTIQYDEEGNEIVEEVVKPLKRNLESDKKLLKQAAFGYFREWPEYHYILDELRQNDSPYSDPVALRRKVHDYLKPFLRRSPSTDRAHERNLLFIRGSAEDMASENAEYLEQLRASLEQADNNNVEAWGSEDRHRLVFVRSYDNVLSVDFQAWYDLRRSYLTYVQRAARALESPARLHIFPAEVHAVQYEQKLEEIGEDYRPFHPKVVMLLQHAERLSLFFRAYAQGWIKLEVDEKEGVSRYVFVEAWTKEKHVIRLTDYANGTRDRHYLRVMEAATQFVLKGKDIKGREHILWRELERALVRAESKVADLEKFCNTKLERRLFQKWQEWAEERIERAKRKGARPREGVSWLTGQEYIDLADVGRIMCHERLEEW